MTYEEITSDLRHGQNFTFARYGDGEFNAILGSKSKRNCDKHQYFTDLGLRLYKILESKPKYVMGMQSLAKRIRGDSEDFKSITKGIDWVNSDVLHHASVSDKLRAFFEALKERDIIIIGNESMAGMTFYISGFGRYYNHIVISPVDCWLEYKDILKRLNEIITKDVVILYAASMASEVLIDDIYNLYDNRVTQIDVGSAFDPYLGIRSRKYHYDLEI